MPSPPTPAAVSNVLSGYAPAVRQGVTSLRELIFDVAGELPEIGGVDEALRWGQPAYLTLKRAGSTLRLGPHRDASFALYAHCQTTIIADYTEAFPGWDRIDGNRAVLFDDVAEIEPERLRHLIRHALTYHLSAAA